MKKLILASLLVACSVAHAETLVARTPTSSITLIEKPCDGVVKNLLRKEYHDVFKTAIVVVHGKSYASCWVRHDERRFYIKMENGEEFLSPDRVYKADLGV